MTTLPQILICILGVLTCFIFLLSLIVCCLQRCIGTFYQNLDIIDADEVFYQGQRHSLLRDEDPESPSSSCNQDVVHFEVVKPTLIHQTIDVKRFVTRSWTFLTFSLFFFGKLAKCLSTFKAEICSTICAEMAVICRTSRRQVKLFGQLVISQLAILATNPHIKKRKKIFKSAKSNFRLCLLIK